MHGPSANQLVQGRSTIPHRLAVVRPESSARMHRSGPAEQEMQKTASMLYMRFIMIHLSYAVMEHGASFVTVNPAISQSAQNLWGGMPHRKSALDTCNLVFDYASANLSRKGRTFREVCLTVDPSWALRALYLSAPNSHTSSVLNVGEDTRGTGSVESVSALKLERVR